MTHGARDGMWVLLVEDNPGDVDLALEYFESSSNAGALHVARDGEDALRRLERAARDGLPRLIILDLNLPGVSGMEVLTAIKGDDRFRHIPVIVFSASENHSDICKSYRNNANCYITKPMDFDEYARVFQSIETFWFHTAKLPGGGAHERTEHQVIAD
jgi:two-component system response regulator